MKLVFIRSMIYLPILISFFEVLAFIIPVLMIVAFVTIAERKTMASMQRRLGPNYVGLEYNYIYQSKRLFHSSLKSKKDIINRLNVNRIAAVKLFDSKILDYCYNLTSYENKKKLFFDKYIDKRGIYLIKCKDDETIYYIGRAKNIKNRLNIHLKTKVTDKFHLFTNLVGWDKFTFSIIEICDLNIQKDR